MPGHDTPYASLSEAHKRHNMIHEKFNYQLHNEVRMAHFNNVFIVRIHDYFKKKKREW